MSIRPNITSPVVILGFFEVTVTTRTTKQKVIPINFKIRILRFRGDMLYVELVGSFTI
jgi:hypothetical protein